MLRAATLDDLSALLTIETRCFSSDRLSRRSFRHLLTRGHAVTLVVEENEQICGYVLLLFSRGTSMARLYSIAVHPDFAHRRIGDQLLQAAETAALERDCGLACPYAAHAPTSVEGAACWSAGTTCITANVAGLDVDVAGALSVARELGVPSWVAAELLSAEAKPNTRPPKFSIAASKLKRVLVLGS